ncbi:MAG: DUF362 domain-containing protein [Turicibacter sp.]|nr:DUF362 domain-containing protein [Turicibacter sp.]
MLTINYGKDIQKTTYETLTASDITTYLQPQMTVAIKPNMVLVSPPSDGATTHSEVAAGIIEFLRDFGVRDIKIMESSAVGNDTKKAYKICGFDQIGARYNVPLIDLKNAPAKTYHFAAKQPAYELDIKIANAPFEVDFLINVPVLKAHCQTRLTCCMKNLKGCIPEAEMRRYHTLGLHQPIAALATTLPVHYNVVDSICGDLSFEEGGTPVETNRIIAGRDMLTVDSFCAELIGYRPEDIGYLKLARDNGLGKFFSPENTKVVELNADKKPSASQKSVRLSERYSRYITENAACSVCYSALVYGLHRLGGAPRSKICIGQGFRGKAENAVGIGDCTRNFDKFVAGCPPKAVDITEFLRKV